MLLSEIGGKTTANLSEIGGKHPSEFRGNGGNRRFKFRGNGENRHFKFRGNGIFQHKPLWHNKVTKTAKKRHKNPLSFSRKRRAACQPRAPPAPSPEPLFCFECHVIRTRMHKLKFQSTCQSLSKCVWRLESRLLHFC